MTRNGIRMSINTKFITFNEIFNKESVINQNKLRVIYFIVMGKQIFSPRKILRSFEYVFFLKLNKNS